MTETYYPHSTHNSGDVTDSEYESLATGGYVTDGIVGSPTDPAFIFGDSSGRQVKARGGVAAYCRGGRYLSSVDKTLTIAANSSGQTRFDLVTVRLDRSAVSEPAAAPHVITGTPGSGVPSPTQNAAGSGVWDFPVASVRVVNGASTIAAGDVTPLGWYIAPQSVVCKAASEPPQAAGLLSYETDTGILALSTGSTRKTVFQDSGNLTPSAGTPGWTVPSGGLPNTFRAVGGWASIAGEVQRFGSGTLGQDDQSTVLKFPSQYAPSVNKAVLIEYAVSGASVLGDGFIDTSGNVVVRFHPALPVGSLVIIPLVTWPIG